MTIAWRTLGAGDLDHERLWLCVLAAAWGLALLVLYESGVPPLVCPFKALTGWPCLTCGSGRALVALAAGQPWLALRANPLVPLAALASAVYGLYAAASCATDRRVRIGLTGAGWRAVRGLTALGAAALWVWLVWDGR